MANFPFSFSHDSSHRTSSLPCLEATEALSLFLSVSLCPSFPIAQKRILRVSYIAEQHPSQKRAKHAKQPISEKKSKKRSPKRGPETSSTPWSAAPPLWRLYPLTSFRILLFRSSPSPSLSIIFHLPSHHLHTLPIPSQSHRSHLSVLFSCSVSILCVCTLTWLELARARQGNSSEPKP